MKTLIEFHRTLQFISSSGPTLLLLSASVLLSGCATALRSQPMAPHPEEVSAYDTYWDIKKDTSEVRKFLKSDQSDTDKKKEICYARLYSVDIVYRDYISALYSEGKKVNLAKDGAINILGGLVTMGDSVFAAKEVKAFGAATTFINATKSSWDSEVYYRKTIEVLIKTMDESRGAARETALALIENNDTSIFECFSAIDKYFKAGTLYSAIDVLHQADTQAAAEKKFKEDEKKPKEGNDKQKEKEKSLLETQSDSSNKPPRV